MNIYEIDSAILACVDSETGEVIDIEKLAELQVERERKIESVACWVKNLTANAQNIREEEKVLAEGLEGYSEYKNRVKYRLIPFIW